MEKKKISEEPIELNHEELFEDAEVENVSEANSKTEGE